MRLKISGLYLTQYTKINSKWINKLKKRTETIKLFFDFGNGFLDMIQKSYAT